ncbi:MAG TPA: amidohydrolase family protein, partial [Candidatus Limnocylindrales bacterium]|nr:amidohydrolase family protein [Candidatus Limnocylindrales bacterium]
VGIRNGRFARIGVVHGQGRTEIDATGRYVSPGWIDMMDQSGGVLPRNPLAENKLMMGVTTAIGGEGGTPVPASEIPAYFRRLETQGISINFGSYFSETQTRVPVLGRSARAPTADELGRMRAIMDTAMRNGAMGMTTALIYPPSSYATTDELAALASEAGRLGGFYHSHVRYTLGDRFLDPFREAIEIGRRADAPSHITHFYHRATFPGTPDQMLALVDDARSEGLDVTFDAYPSEWASTRLLITVPLWVQEGGPGPTKERLADPAVRERIRVELQERGVLYAGPRGLAAIRLGAFRSPRNVRWEGYPLGEVAAVTGRDPVDALCDLLLEEDLRLNQVTPGPHIDGIRRFYQHPVSMVGTDSTFVGAKPSPRTYGSYPRILGQFVRDEAILTLEAAVAKMTSLPADRLGLRDRGRLADGLVADVVVFNPATVRSTATYHEPRQFPKGIEHVIVNGRHVVEYGAPTGALPGRSLRRGRA